MNKLMTLKNRHNKLIVFFIFLILVFLLKFNTINLPYTRDALGVYVTPSIWVKEHNFNPFHGNEYWPSHPPLFFEILAVSFSIFGVHLCASHLVVLVSTAVTLYYTYLIGSYLYKPKVGFTAALLLLFSPLFFAQSGMVVSDVFLTMMATITIYYAIQKKLIPYIIFGSLLVLTKEHGVIIITAITTYKLFFEKTKIKTSLLYFSPVIAFLIWLLLSKLVYGWFFFPGTVMLFSFKTFLKEILYRINQAFIIDYKLILTLFIFLLVVKYVRPHLKRSKMIIRLIVIAVSYIACRYIANILFLTQSVAKIDLVRIFQVNLHNLYTLRYVIPLLILIIFLIPEIIRSRNILLKNFKNEVILLLICIFSIILFFSFMSYGYQQRFILLIYPLLFIIGSKALSEIFKNKWYIIITLVLLALFVTQWWANIYPVCGSCEENLQYLTVISIHQDMAKFIESNYPYAIVLTEVPQSQELRYPFAGYVKKEIKTLEVEKDTFLREWPGNYKAPPLEDFDLVYYCIGGIDSKALEEVVNLNKLVLIKKIEKNGKIAFLYGKNG